MLAAGTVLAHGSEKGKAPRAATPQAMDHSKMDMPGTKPADHQKMATTEFVKLHKNKDGKLGKAEIPSQHPMAAHFGMLDTSKDGSLSKAEFAKHHAMMGMQSGQMDHSKMDMSG